MTRYRTIPPPMMRGFSARIARMAAVAGLCSLVLFGYGAATGVDAQESKTKEGSSAYSEHLVKAAFLYNFAKFTEWPSETYADDAAPLRVCVLGEDPSGKALDSLAGKQVNGRLVMVNRLAGVEETRPCQVVFISESEEVRVRGIVDYLAGQPILTVCNAPSCAQFKGIIHLKVVAQKIRFAIDVDTAEAARLKLSSKLLALAEKLASSNKTQASLSPPND